jgi:hypothetical protein
MQPPSPLAAPEHANITAMADGLDGAEERIGKNEAIFRTVNEQIEASQLPADTEKLTAFCCECARLGCDALVDVTIAAYERVRADPRHFLLAAGHEIEGAEVVVDRKGGYVVVEKIGDAARVARATDPRKH